MGKSVKAHLHIHTKEIARRKYFTKSRAMLAPTRSSLGTGAAWYLLKHPTAQPCEVATNDILLSHLAAAVHSSNLSSLGPELPS
jgi:hypothetical protein